MIIRKIKNNDIRKVYFLIKRCLYEVNIKDYSQEVMEKVMDDYLPSKIRDKIKKRLFYIALIGKKIVGTISLEENTIYTLFVNPDYHNKGIGRKLMNFIEKVALEKGHKTVELPSSITAHKFYKKLGYKDVKKIKPEGYGHMFIMKKKLN